MHNINRYVERPSDAGCLYEQGIVEAVSPTERSTETSDQVHFTVEMAVEWAHLGGD
jgi:hypothetical protein